MSSRFTRRRFLGTSLSAGAASALAPSCAPPPNVGQDSPAAPGEFELDEVTISELQESMESGRLTCRRVVELYLERIDGVDRDGPGLRSIIEVNPDAVQIADELDEERRANGPRGPLHGVPVLLKDNLATADRMMTTAGSFALEGSHPERDSFVAERLRAGGAVLLAKTNLSEWANFRSTRSSSGWSARGGQCRNPYVLDRNPCGSSSGSGAATSANLGAVAIGTETNGSVVCPSNANGLVGVKPTLGLVSRSGIVPIAHSQDTAGPMTRSVTDAAIVLSAIVGADSRDPITAAAAQRGGTDFTRFLDPEGLRRKRIGVARQYFGFHGSVDAVMEAALDAMTRLGAELVDPIELPASEAVGESEFLVLLYEFKADLAAYLAGLGAATPHRTLADIIRFNEDNREREMPFFDQEIFLQAEEKGPLTERTYLDALARNTRLSRAEGIDAAIAANRLDALVAPTGGPAWVTDLVNGDHFAGGSSTLPAIAGYPNVTVPAGDVHGLPVGISFFGEAFAEPALFAMAYAFEQATNARRKPAFLPTLG